MAKKKSGDPGLKKDRSSGCPSYLMHKDSGMVWIEINDVTIYIQRKTDGVMVELLRNYNCAGIPLDSATAFFKEKTDE